MEFKFYDEVDPEQMATLTNFPFFIHADVDYCY